MEFTTKIIPLRRRLVERRIVPLSTGPRPDIQAVLEMLHDIDPALLARVAPGPAQAPAGAPHLPTGRTTLPCPPRPANATPALPLPDTDARARTLTSVVFPEGSSRVLTCSMPHLSFTVSLR